MLSLQSIINDLFTINKPLVASKKLIQLFLIEKKKEEYHKISDHYNSCLFLKLRNILMQVYYL